MSRQPPPRELRPGVALFVVAFLFSPVVLLTWACGQAWLRRTGWRGWRLAVPALAAGGLVVLVEGGPLAALALHFSGYLALLAQFGQPAIHLPAPGSFLWPQLPLAVPTGLLAASMNTRRTAVVPAEFERAEQRRRARAEQRTRRRAHRTAAREATRPDSGALGAWLGGDLASWQQGRLVVPQLASWGWRPCWSAPPAPARRSASNASPSWPAASAATWWCWTPRAATTASPRAWSPPTSRRGRMPASGCSPRSRWTSGGAPPAAVVNRLVNVWDWSPESAYYREVATVALRLAVGQPGPPCTSTSELLARLDPAALARAWSGRQAETNLVRGLKDRLADVQLRVANLIAALGSAFDGAWSWEDADAAVVTVPSMVASLDADACLRVLLSDVGHFTMARKHSGTPALVVVDEFSAIQGGRRAAIDLLERSRGAGTGVVLAAQSSVALGDEDERARLLAAASAVVAFRSPQPAELAALAGSERIAEAAWQADAGDLTGRQTITMRARGRVDQDAVRGARIGEAHVIAAGRVARARIIRTAINQDVRTRAGELVAGEQPGALPTAEPTPLRARQDPEDPKELPA